MTPLFPSIPVDPPEPASGLQTLALQSFSYEARRVILPALSEALTHCGCWLSERKVKSTSQIEFVFELQHRLVLDLYSALIGVGLELTPPPATSTSPASAPCSAIHPSPPIEAASSKCASKSASSKNSTSNPVLTPGAARA